MVPQNPVFSFPRSLNQDWRFDSAAVQNSELAADVLGPCCLLPVPRYTGHFGSLTTGSVCNRGLGRGFAIQRVRVKQRRCFKDLQTKHFLHVARDWAQ